MADIPVAVRDHYRHVLGWQAAALGVASRAWAEVSPNAISESWSTQVPYLAQSFDALRRNVAVDSAIYTPLTLSEQGQYRVGDAFTDVDAFLPTLATGGDLEAALYVPAIRTKEAIRRGVGVADALDTGKQSLYAILTSALSDTGRQVGGVAVASRPKTGYTRMLNPPSCERCVVLAGRFYRWNTGFLRHPRCFPAGTVVSGPEFEAAARRWYEGELVILTTASGQELSLTANHPVLTRRGWVPAHLLNEGDDVFRSTDSKGTPPLVVPHHHEMPSLIEDVWSSFGVGGLDAVPTSSEDFHGDGIDGEVDIVYANSALRDRVQAPFLEHSQHESFAGRLGLAGEFDMQGVSEFFDLRDRAHSGSSISGGNLLLPFGGAHVRIAGNPGLRSASWRDSGHDDFFSDSRSRNSELFSDSVFRSPSAVGSYDFFGGQDDRVSARWDAPGAEFSIETRTGYRYRGQDLLNRLSGTVEADSLVKVERVQWSGHVYSLTSSEGWHNANNLIVSNCDCVHVPTGVKSTAGARAEGLIDDPYEYFHSLSQADQNRVFGEAYAQAVRDGGDIFQIINSKRGRNKQGIFTTEGTTRRGYAGASLKRGQKRLTPEGIYKLSSSQHLTREQTLDLLKEHGYILPGGQNPTGALRGQREGFGALGRGGTRRAASEAVLEARRTGVRGPHNVYTMTESERRLFYARRDFEETLSGLNPYTEAAIQRRQGTRPWSVDRPVTDSERARAEAWFQAMQSTGGQLYLPDGTDVRKLYTQFDTDHR